MVGEHGKQYGQCEIRVVHTALLATLGVNGVRRFARLHGCHHLALPGNDPKKHISAHDGAQHGAHDQKCCTPCKHMAGQPSCRCHVKQDPDTDHTVAAWFVAPKATNPVVHHPTHYQKPKRQRNGGGGRHVKHTWIHHVSVGVEQVQHHHQTKAGQPSGISLPVEPVQVLRELRWGDQILLWVVKTSTMNRPKFTAHAFGLELGCFGR